MNKKQGKLVEGTYLKMIHAEANKVNAKLEEDLRKIIKNGESLINYELWVNEKCNIFIKTDYIIEIFVKDFEKERISCPPYKNNELVYVLMKKDIESEEK